MTHPPELVDTPKGLTLQLNDKKSLHIDFTCPAFLKRITHPLRFREPLARACGLKKNKTIHCIDFTAGLGHDAFFIASFGGSAHLFERHPLIHALLKDALDRAKHHPSTADISQRIQLTHGEAQDHLPTLTALSPCHVLLVDPMFPPKKKSAAPPGAIQCLQTIVGADDDADDLIAFALQFATTRRLIKRHRTSAPPNPAPDLSIHGKSHRFDIYCPKK